MICSDAGPSNSRKRKRNPHVHKKHLAEKAVEQGLEQKTTSGKTVRAKVFEAQTLCKCSPLCSSKIHFLRQKEIFESFYGRSTTQQTLMLRAAVQNASVKNRVRSFADKSKEKEKFPF